MQAFSKWKQWMTPGIALLLFVLAGSGCGRSEGERAQTVARDFIAAMNRDDDHAAELLLTAAARQKINEGHDTEQRDPLSESEKSVTSDQFTVGDAVISDDAASVPVVLTSDRGNQDAKVRLRRENGEWKVYALAFSLKPRSDADFTIDFEHPEAMVGETLKVIGEDMGRAMKEAGKGAGEGMAALMKGLGEGAAAFEKGYREEQSRQQKEDPPIIVERGETNDPAP